MAAVRQLGFFKICFFKEPLGFGGPMCINVQNFIKICQNSHLFCFQDGDRLPFWICEAKISGNT